MTLLALAASSIALFAQQDEPTSPFLGGFAPIILIFLVFYLLLIRPQQRRARKRRELVASIEPDDRVVTIGGLHGTVRSLDGDRVRLEVAPGMVLTVSRGAIAEKVADGGTGTDPGTIG
jgi:preprotein translocase subunit YajC